MSILNRFQERVEHYRQQADQRAEKRLAQLKTKVARDREYARIQREKLKSKKEVTEARTALLRAEARKKRAAKEVRAIGGGIFADLQGYFYPPPAKRRKRRVTRKSR